MFVVISYSVACLRVVLGARVRMDESTLSHAFFLEVQRELVNR